MNPWQHAFLVGFYPQMSDDEVTAVFNGCALHDPNMCQCAIVRPQYLAEGLITGLPRADPIVFGWMRAGRPASAGDIEQEWYGRCFAADDRLGEPGGCSHFITWWDETPIREAQTELARLIWTARLGKRKPWHER